MKWIGRYEVYLLSITPESRKIIGSFTHLQADNFFTSKENVIFPFMKISWLYQAQASYLLTSAVIMLDGKGSRKKVRYLVKTFF